MGRHRRAVLVRSFRRALITNVLSPKVIVFTSAFLPQFVNPGMGNVGMQLLVLGVTLVLTDLLIDGAIGLGTGRIGPFLRRPRMARALNVMCGTIFTALAVDLVVSYTVSTASVTAPGTVAITLGVPSFDAADIPLLDHTGPAVSVPIEVDGRTWPLTGLNNGNPHAILIAPEPDRDLLHHLDPRLAAHPLPHQGQRPPRRHPQPRSPARPLLGTRRGPRPGLRQRHLRRRGSPPPGPAAPTTTATTPGGQITITIDAKGSVSMSGPVECVFTGHLAPHRPLVRHSATGCPRSPHGPRRGRHRKPPLPTPIVRPSHGRR